MAESSGAEPMKLTIDQAIDRLGLGAFQHRLLISAGLCNMSDAMEVLLLSFLTIVVQKEFGVGPHEGSLVTSVVFIGAMIGTLTLGHLGDKYGRKPIFLVGAIIISVSGLLSAAAQNYWTMVALRFGVGIGLGGIVIPFDTLTEFIPSADRGEHLIAAVGHARPCPITFVLLCLLTMAVANFFLYGNKGHYIPRFGLFWAVGTMSVPLLAYLGLQQENSWRLFVLLCSFPCLLSTILAVFWVPESPRWLIHHGKPEKALEILRQGAIMNGKDPKKTFPDGIQFVSDPNEEDHLHSIFCLLKKEWIRLTLCIWGVWFGKSFMYWGTIQVITLAFSRTNPESGDVSYDFDYGAILASSMAELVGVSIVIFSVDRAGRKASQSAAYMLGGGLVFGFCWTAGTVGNVEKERTLLILLAFFSRMSVMAAAQITWLMTAELIPTQIRTTGHASASAVSRVGGSLMPWLVSPENSLQTIGIVLGCFGLYTGALVCLLPETAGRSLGTARAADESYKADGKPLKTNDIL